MMMIKYSNLHLQCEGASVFQWEQYHATKLAPWWGQRSISRMMIKYLPYPGAWLHIWEANAQGMVHTKYEAGIANHFRNISI